MLYRNGTYVVWERYIEDRVGKKGNASKYFFKKMGGGGEDRYGIFSVIAGSRSIVGNNTYFPCVYRSPKRPTAFQ